MANADDAGALGVGAPRPEVFGHYRPYLNAMIDWLKATDPDFSARRFTRDAGLQMPNYLTMVANGQRNLQGRSIQPIVRGLRLEGDDAEALAALIRLSIAEERLSALERKGSGAGRAAENHRAIRARARLALATVAARRSTGDLLPEQDRVFYGDPNAKYVFELAPFAPVDDPAGWMAEALDPRAGRAEVQRTLDGLLAAGLLVWRRGGRLARTQLRLRRVEGGPAGAAYSALVRENNKAALGHLQHQLDRLPLCARHVIQMVLTLDDAGYERACALLQRFHDELMALDVDPSTVKGPVRVFQVGVGVAPASQAVETST